MKFVLLTGAYVYIALFCLDSLFRWIFFVKDNTYHNADLQKLEVTLNNSAQNLRLPTFKTCFELYRERTFLMDYVSSSHTPPLLYSFPGSGSTWCRLLIDFASGIYSGSVYDDSALFRVLPGEKMCNKMVSVIKAHPHIQTFKILSSGNLLPKKCTTGNITHFNRAIFLVRNPYHAIWSEYQRRMSGSHVGWITKANLNIRKWNNHRNQLSTLYKTMISVEYAGLIKVDKIVFFKSTILARDYIS